MKIGTEEWALKMLSETENKYKNDPEQIHIHTDMIINEVLRHNGFESIVEMRLEMQSRNGGFWYA